MRTYTKKQMEQFIEDDKVSPEQQRIADQVAKLPPKKIRTIDSAAVRVLKLAGVWSDLDWEGAEKDLDRIRHESNSNPTIQPVRKDENPSN